MVSGEIILWSDLPCKDGEPLEVATGLEAVHIGDALDGSAPRCVIEAAAGQPWLAEAKARRVIQVPWNGQITEWRIASRTDRLGRGSGLVTIVGAPVIQDLARAGPVRAYRGNLVYWNLGARDDIPVAPGVYVDTFVLTNLAEDDLEWLGRGTIEPTERKAFSWNRWKRLQILREIEKRWIGAEVQLRRDGDDGYLIDILQYDAATGTGGIGSDRDVIYVRLDRNLISLERTEEDADYASAIIPAGDVPDGSVEPAGIGYACWEVTDITGDEVTCVDPDGGPDPALWADQFNGRYLRKPNGTRTEIVDTIVGGSGTIFKVASAADLVVGDVVEIRANSSGRLLHELENPAAREAHGRAARPEDFEGFRGERNHVPNAFFRNWDTDGQETLPCSVPDDQGTTASVVVTSLPLNKTIPAGSIIRISAGVSPVQRRITVEATTDGSGDVTLTLASSVNLPANSGTPYWAQIVILPPLPDGWDVTQQSVGGTLFFPATFEETGNLNGQANGAHSFTSEITVDGLTPGAIIEPGATVQVDGGLGRPAVFERAVVDEAGEVTLKLDGATALADDNDPVVILRPEPAFMLGAKSLSMPEINDTPTGIGARGFTSPAYRIYAGEGTLRARAYLTLVAHDNVTFSPTSPSSSVLAPPSLVIRNTSGFGSTLAGKWAGVTSMSRDEVLPVTIDVECELSGDTTVELWVGGPRRIANNAFTNLDAWMYLHGVMLWLGSDPAAPAIEHSLANALWHQASDRLWRLSTGMPTILRMSMADLERMGVLPSGEENVGLGGRVLIETDEFGSALARIIALNVDVLDPKKTEVLLNTAPPRHTLYARGQQRRVFVQFSVTNTTVIVNEASEVQSIEVSEKTKVIPAALNAPAETPGALRMVLPVVETPSSGVADLEPLEDRRSGTTYEIPVP